MREFYEDIKEKKRAASGIFKRKGKRGYVGKMYTPVDFMRGAEKRKYTKGGKIVTYNMYDDLNKEKFEELPDEEKKLALTYLRDNYSLQELEDDFNLSNYHVYKWVDKLGLPKAGNDEKQRAGAEKRLRKKAEQEKVIAAAPQKQKEDKQLTVLDFNNFENDLKQQLAAANEKIKELEAQLHKQNQKQENTINYVGSKKEPAELMKRLEKLQLIIDDENCLFDYSITIKEIEKEKEPQQEFNKGSEEAAAAIEIEDKENYKQFSFA